MKIRKDQNKESYEHEEIDQHAKMMNKNERMTVVKKETDANDDNKKDKLLQMMNIW